MSIGQALAAARREAGMSVEQVSAATRIRRTIVSAIENDDFSLCGGDFYARAHVRSIAQAVRIDPAPLLERYDAARGGAREPTLEPVQADVVRAGSGGPNWSAAMAAALVLVLCFGVYRAVSGGDGPPDQRVDQAVARPGATPPAAPPRPSASTNPTPDAIAQAPRVGVSVRLTASGGASWVRVTNASGRELFEGILARGTSRVVTDPKRVRLVVGNAGAVTLVVNGKSLGAPGRPGSVARVEFGPGEPAAG